MKENLGKTLYNFRVNKGMKQKDLISKRISIGQISNIENGLQMPSAERFILLLGKLNVDYDEFIFMMGDEKLTARLKMEKNFVEFVRDKNHIGLENLAKQASNLFLNHGELYFQHIKLTSLALAQLIKRNNNDYEKIKVDLSPIIEYLENIKEWGFYELTLFSRCLFVFNIEKAISFGNRALELIEQNYTFYKHEEVGHVTLINLAVYTLNYESYHHLSLKYSQMGIDFAVVNSDAMKVLQGKIIYQIACFKLGNGLYNESKLLTLIKAFKLLGWHKDYEYIDKFINKHRILP